MPASVFHSFFFFFSPLTLHEQLSLCKQRAETIPTINCISDLEFYFDFSAVRVTSLEISNILLMLKRAGKSCQLRVFPINLSVNWKPIATKIFAHKTIAAKFGRDLSCKPEN